jgi:hypothetical protein
LFYGVRTGVQWETPPRRRNCSSRRIVLPSITLLGVDLGLPAVWRNLFVANGVRAWMQLSPLASWRFRAHFSPRRPALRSNCASGMDSPSLITLVAPGLTVQAQVGCHRRELSAPAPCGVREASPTVQSGQIGASISALPMKRFR